MNKFKLILNLIFCCCLAQNALAAGSSDINDYKIITEDYAPFNFHNDGKIVGISYEILDKILKKMKSKKINEVIIQPWDKSFNEVQITENTMIFSTARSKARENLFKWVGPIFSSKYVVFAKKSSQIKISAIKDLKLYKIGVMRGDQAEAKMRSLGITNKHISANDDIPTNLKKLLTGRVDLLAIQENSLKSEMEKIEEDYNDLEIVFELDNKNLYFAFNINTPDELIGQFSDAFNEVKNSGHYNQILDKYLKNQ